MAAAVGSLRILSTEKPAIRAATLVSERCTSLKFAGTVITASVISTPRMLLHSSRKWRSIMADTSGREISRPCTLMEGI